MKTRYDALRLCAVAAGMALFAAIPGRLCACTLWGAAGSDASGGTIISKNRDWAPDHTQVLKLRRSTKGYSHFGLYAVGGTEPGIKAGVNEKGLTVITASASSSLWRTGKNSRTLASWIVETPAQGAPKLRVVIANPEQKEETHVLVLDQRFWRETK